MASLIVIDQPEYDIAALKAQIDLRAILTPGMAAKGDKPTVMPCLFHQETKGSLHVYPSHLHCYGCQTHMDIIDFVAWREGMDTSQDMGRILDLVANQYAGFVPAPPAPKPKKPLTPLSRKVAEYFHERLGPKRRYFRERGLNDETINRELLGYAANAFVIPVWSAEGELVTLRYRRDDAVKPDGPKYWGTEGRNDAFLYNMAAARFAQDWGFLVITEGELDALRLFQEGLAAISATNGVGAFDDAMARQVKKAHQGLCVIAYDQDEPGRINSIRVARLFGMKGRVARWPVEWGKDATDVLKARAFDDLALQFLDAESPARVEGYWHNTLRSGVWR